jgi:hypothetical protein
VAIIVGTPVTSSSTSVTIPATTGGTALVVCVMGSSGSGTPSVTGVTLGGSSTGWAQAETEHDSSDESLAAIWYNTDIAGGQTALVVTGTDVDVASGYGGIVVLPVSGLLAVGALDKVSKGTNTSSSFSSGATGTLTQASEVAFGCCNASAGSAAGPASPWTNTSPAGTVAVAGYQVVSATTSLTYTGTCSGSLAYSAVIVSFIGAAVAAPPPQLQIPPGPFSPMNFRRRVFAVPPPVTSADTGSGADSGTVTAALAAGDTGSGADAGAVTVLGAEAGAGADAASVAATLASGDTGSGADVASAGIPAVSGDTGSGTDSGTLRVPGPDTGSGADTGSVTATVSSQDTGTGADTGRLMMAGSDTGSGVESASVTIRPWVLWRAPGKVSTSGDVMQ